MRRRIDQALCDRAELLARSHPLGTVAEILDVLPSTVSKMRKRGWRAGDWSCQRRSRPTDFAIRAFDMTHAELCAHYGCGTRTVTRWFAEKPAVRPSWRGRHLRRVGT